MAEEALAPDDLRRKRVKTVTFIILLLLLLALIGALIYLLLTGRPLVRPVRVPGKPSYLYSIYGTGDVGSLNGPLGVVVDSKSGRVYVTDTNSDRVVAFTRRGRPLFTFNEIGKEGKLLTPVYLAVNSKGEVYVSDRFLSDIYVFSSEGKFLKKFLPEGQEDFAYGPLGLTFDKKDNLYVTDVGNHKVWVFDKKGNRKLDFGTLGQAFKVEEEKGKFYFPNQIAVDKKGRIYVADFVNRRVQVFDSKGKFLYLKAAGSSPGIGVDNRERIYITDIFGHEFKILDGKKKGKIIFTLGERGMETGQFNFPNGLALDSQNRIYITDRDNNRVQVWGY